MNNLQTTNDLQTTKGMNLCMTNSRRKGKVGELEVVRLCKAEGYDVHRSAQFCGNNESGAADVVGLPGIHIEVKRVEHLNLDDALAQATRDAGKTTGNIPAVFHRKNGTGWKVTMDAHDWFKLYREWEAGLVDE